MHEEDNRPHGGYTPVEQPQRTAFPIIPRRIQETKHHKKEVILML
jgi:hypothetical protein